MNSIDFRTARQAAQDDPADLEMARQRFAPHLQNLNTDQERTLRRIRSLEKEIADRANQIRLLRMQLEA